MPEDVKKYYTENPGSEPVGFHGRDLGFELDLHYKMHLRHGFTTGVSAAALLPGNAWKTASNKSPTNNYRLEFNLIFKI